MICPFSPLVLLISYMVRIQRTYRNDCFKYLPSDGWLRDLAGREIKADFWGILQVSLFFVD